MITLTREEAQQVLHSLLNYPMTEGKAIQLLRAKLSEPESHPEPVAWMNEGDIGKTDCKVWAHGKPTATIPLYTAPLQREWVGLTDEELEFYTEELGQGELGRGVLRAVIDFLKEKNT